MKLFALPMIENHKASVDKHCFGDCGKISVGGLDVAGLPCFPCKEEICPYEEKRLDMEFRWHGQDDMDVWLRRLKETP